MSKKIIVIDDSQTIRDQVGTTLRQAGYEIVEAVDGVDGAEVIERSPDAALVICEEELDGGTLIASNFFVNEDGAWHIAHHQAGQLVVRRSSQAQPRRPSGSRLN